MVGTAEALAAVSKVLRKQDMMFASCCFASLRLETLCQPLCKSLSVNSAASKDRHLDQQGSKEEIRRQPWQILILGASIRLHPCCLHSLSMSMWNSPACSKLHRPLRDEVGMRNLGSTILAPRTHAGADPLLHPVTRDRDCTHNNDQAALVAEQPHRPESMLHNENMLSVHVYTDMHVVCDDIHNLRTPLSFKLLTQGIIQKP